MVLLLCIKSSPDPSREPALIRGIETTNEGQTDLSAMSVACQNVIHIPLFQCSVHQKADRHMAQQNGIGIGILKFFQKAAFLFPGFFGLQVFFRQSIAVIAAEAQVLGCDVKIFIIQ